jgi:hypothetical protein
MAQTAEHEAPEPDNADVVQYMRDAMHRLNPDPVDYVLSALEGLE